MSTLTKIFDLWVPEVWSQTTTELAAKIPSIINSGVAIKSTLFDQLASGGGRQVEVPFFNEPIPADEIQVEDSGPTINALTSGQQTAPILNRVTSLGATALSGAVSDSDPIDQILTSVARRRLFQRQATLVSILQGIFGTALASMVLESFVEASGSVTTAHRINPKMVGEALNFLGELKSDAANDSVLIVHPDIELAMANADHIEYHRNSEGRLTLKTYLGLPIFLSDALVRPGTTSGKVYTSYLLGRGSFAHGEKPQSDTVGDVASMVLDRDAHKNNVTLYDRTRFILHPAGLRWVGTPDGQSATNAELADESNWELAFADAKNCRLLAIRTNG